MVGPTDGGWKTDALESLDRVTGTGLADRYRERRADRAFRERSRRRERTSAGDDAPDHVVVVVVDALRADALGGPTPFLEGLDGGTAIAPSTWTFPSVTSLLTGQYPTNHGAVRRTDDFEDSVVDMTGLPPKSDAAGVAGRFAGAGYDTYGGFGMIVPFLALSGRFGTHRLYDDASAERVLADHLDWLADRRETRDRRESGGRGTGRTFSYLHLADLHEPVDPPREYWQAHDVDASIPGIRAWRHEDVVADSPAVERYREHRGRLYRAAVEYVDNRLEAYARRLSDLLGDVALAVVGDHGEGFWERAGHAADAFADPRPAYCVGHGGAPYEVVTRVPLRTAGLNCDFEGDDPVSLVDLAPTLADAAGLSLPDANGVSFPDADSVSLPDADGVSLRGSVPGDRILRVESARYGYEKRAAYRDGRKLVVSRGDDYAEGFSVSGDSAVPDEEPANLPPALESDLRDALSPWVGEREMPGDGGDEETEASRSVERQLADLGYR